MTAGLSPRFLARAHELVAIGTYSIDPVRRTIALSAEACRLLGAGDVAIEMPLEAYRRRFYHPEDLARGEARAEAAYRDGRPLLHESRVIRGDGRVIWVRAASSMERDDAGAPIILGVLQDVTDRRESDAALRASELRFRLLIEKAPVAIGVSRDGVILYVNEKFARLFGLPGAASVVGRSIGEHWAPETREVVLQRHRDRVAGREVASSFEGTGQRLDGTTVPVQVEIETIDLPEGPTSLAFFTDLTERKRAQQALVESEARFASIFRNAPVAMLLGVARDGRIVDVNQNFEALMGHVRADAVGRTTVELGMFFHATDRDRNLQAVRSVRGPRTLELDLRTRHGARMPIRASAQVIELGGVEHILSAFVDLTETKAAEAAVRESEARLRRVVASPILGFAFGTSAGIVREANDEFWRIVGRRRDELAEDGLSFRELTPPDDWPKLQGAFGELAKQGTNLFETFVARPDGSQVPVILGASRLDDASDGAFCFVFDLTERRDLQRQLQHAQRMEAVGRLAAGIAHDFNNVLSTVTMSSDLLRVEVGAAGNAAELVGEIRSAADRAAALTRQLLAFSRQQAMEPKVLDAGDLLRNLERMLRRLIGADVALETRYDVLAGAVKVDPVQLEQVVVNLAVNARDAMPQGGALAIEVSRCELAAPTSLESGTVPAGLYTVVSVADTGAGMDPDVRRHIFEPFFTTKGSGKGTGLGLAMVYGVVQQSGGFLDLESEVGKGTRFRIFLPAVAERPQDEGRAAQPETRGGSETVLLVEDEELLRRTTRKALAQLGYRVLEASRPSEAREIAGRYVGGIDVLLSDVVMPETKGPTLAKELQAIRPSMAVLLMSGSSGFTAIDTSEFPLIRKPFSRAELDAYLREVLDREGG